MGHGDEIVLADAHFPGHSLNALCLRADGIEIDALLDGILPLWELDTYVDDPLVMMAPVPGDTLDESVERRYRAVIERHAPEHAADRAHRPLRFLRPGSRSRVCRGDDG